jgi:hypothetical protein
MDAVSDLQDSTEFLDIEVDEVAGVVPFVADHGFFWIEVTQPRKASAFEHHIPPPDAVPLSSPGGSSTTITPDHMPASITNPQSPGCDIRLNNVSGIDI